MTTTTQTQTQYETQHSAMLHNARELLSMYQLHGEQQQGAVDDLQGQLDEQQRLLNGNQVKRQELLQALQEAQRVLNLAQASAELAGGTPQEEEYNQRFEEARVAVQGLHAHLMSVAEADTKAREDAQRIEAELNDAKHNFTRLVERIGNAQVVYDETLAKHRNEVCQQALAALEAARLERIAAREAAQKADEGVRLAERDLVNSLKQWPAYAIQEVSILVERDLISIEDDPTTRMLSDRLEACLAAELHCRSIDLDLSRMLARFVVPIELLQRFGTRRELRERAAAMGRSDPTGRGGLQGELWPFDDAMALLGRLVEQSRAANRRRVIEQLVHQQGGE